MDKGTDKVVEEAQTKVVEDAEHAMPETADVDPVDGVTSAAGQCYQRLCY